MNTANHILPLQDLAMSILEAAQENLQRDGRLIPIVFVCPGDGSELMGIPMMFDGPEEKRFKYNMLWEMILPTNPKGVMTLNDCYMKRYAPDAKPEKSICLADAKAAGDTEVAEGIMLMVSTPEHQWGVTVTYIREGEKIVFDPINVMRNEAGAELSGGLLPPLWGKKGKAN